MTIISRLPVYFGPTKKPEEVVAEKKGDELDTSLGKHKIDDSFIEELKAPIRSHFTMLETVAIKKFNESLNMAPWTKMLVTACPKREELKLEWEKAVPALDLRLGKLNAYRFQVGLAGGDPILKGTTLEGIGMKGILEVCWAGKVPEDLKGLVMKKEFSPPSEFPSWEKKYRAVPPK